MKKNIKWRICFVIGICPFILPFIVGLYRMSIESWSMIDWLVMYSFIYWPTYIIGFGLLVVSVYKLMKKS